MSGIDDHMAALAAAARRLYVFHYRQAESRRTGVPSRYLSRPVSQWDGGVDRAGRRHQPVWPRIVRAALAAGASLADYVAAQFAQGADPPRPNQLVGPAAVARYRERAERGVAEARAELDAQHAQLILGVAVYGRLFGLVDDVEATRRVLRDRTRPISALYRYCVASQLGEESIAAEFREGALSQYLTGPARYREAWARVLPRGLAEEGDAVVDGLIRGEKP